MKTYVVILFIMISKKNYIACTTDTLITNWYVKKYFLNMSCPALGNQNRLVGIL